MQVMRQKPPAFRPGDTVGIVAPASNIKKDLLDQGCKRLVELGYKPVYLDSILEQDVYFAGSAARRARELEEMFTRPEVRAILCARGGYGANYLLRGFPAKSAGHPKIFVGYSDITTLLTCFADSARICDVSRADGDEGFCAEDGVDLASWEAALGGVAEWEAGWYVGFAGRGTVEGDADGILYGGCLSLLVASSAHRTRSNGGDDLFLEDVNARPYQIDRMLMQLKLAGKFKGVNGIVFGEMLDCVQTKEQGYTLRRSFCESSAPWDSGGLWVRSGHVTRKNITLPIGVPRS